MSVHEKWMSLALALAQEAYQAGEIPVGAVLVQDGRVIAKARNRCEERHDPTAHAELLAIQEGAQVLAGRRLTDATLYVTLEPCPMCAGAMILARLKGCYFAARDQRQGCCESVYALPQDPAFYHRLPCVGGVLEGEAQALLKQFFQGKRAKAAPGHMPSPAPNPSPQGEGA